MLLRSVMERPSRGTWDGKVEGQGASPQRPAGTRLKMLAYTSRARFDLSSADLVDIHRTSMQQNVLHGITGLLVFDGTRFLQIIEGPDDAIDALVDKLRFDTRHSAFEVRDERTVDRASFPDWTMELIKVDAAYFTARGEIGSLLPATVSPEIRALLDKMASDMSRRFSMPDSA